MLPVKVPKHFDVNANEEMKQLYESDLNIVRFNIFAYDDFLAY